MRSGKRDNQVSTRQFREESQSRWQSLRLDDLTPQTIRVPGRAAFATTARRFCAVKYECRISGLSFRKTLISCRVILDRSQRPFLPSDTALTPALVSSSRSSPPPYKLSTVTSNLFLSRFLASATNCLSAPPIAR